MNIYEFHIKELTEKYTALQLAELLLNERETSKAKSETIICLKDEINTLQTVIACFELDKHNS